MKRLLWIVILCSCPLMAQVTHIASGTGCSKAGSNTGQGSTWTFSCTPNAANHAVTIFVSCGSAAVSSISATGWTFQALSPSTGSSTAGFGASWGAITPNTSATTFTVTGASGCGFVLYIVDEWSGADTTGGTTTFYAHNQSTATSGGCSGSAVTSTSSNDAVWAACSDSLPTSNWAGTGWSGGVNDSGGDASIYKIATGSQTPTWNSTSGAYVVSSATIKSSGGGGPTPNMPPVIY